MKGDSFEIPGLGKVVITRTPTSESAKFVDAVLTTPEGKTKALAVECAIVDHEV